ncbi:SRPBCC family protein [Prauserella cavernicola]|uniref:SRPBCC family protein n=1 Tax=Prauserella cavernicola TaxID=2800127 RepID=A0A934QM99_9PSEU|nr:SRPBCC family protein [Prauserella cavernicola]MBK1783006.1 SRPBCC family protein [Prauserella cavernicola]
MIGVSRVVPAPPHEVFGVLADGWSYAGWVVGNAHIRTVDGDWPSVGSRIHHSAGMWPVQVPDVSTVVAMRPDELLELEARLWVLGRARVRLTLQPQLDGGTEVIMEERVVSGPASLVPVAVQALVVKPRNAEALGRLCDIAVARTALAGARHL